MREYLNSTLRAALKKLGAPPDAPVAFERPRQPEHGDLTTNVALTLARGMKRPPRALAEEIVRTWELDRAFISDVSIAGPGFINLRFTDHFYRAQIPVIIDAGERYGRTEAGAGKKVQVEFVSANPTGPLTVGHGRGAVFGDTVARLYEWTGHTVEREYYFNNAGRQMRVLGDSVRLRYLELLGNPGAFPEDYYQGEYIRDIARHLVDSEGDSLRAEPAEGRFKQQAEQEIFADIRKTLSSIGVAFDSFYNEHSLYTDGKIDDVVAKLREAGLVYEQEGAVWFKLTALGQEKDKVIIKNTGEPTYRLPDIAYHREKYRRGYDLMVDIFGADHIATYPDVLAGMKALGFDPGLIKVLIHQFVTIIQNGEVVKMSTRKANFITLDELVAEVGADAVRYFFIMRTITSHLNFDLGLAKEESSENPVYYLQYAHARLASIFRKAVESPLHRDLPEANLDLLCEPEEMALVRKLAEFPQVVESCALTNEPHRLADYLHAIAGEFHLFYSRHLVLSENRDLSSARLLLCRAAQLVLRNGLSILGIAAPEQM